MCGTKLPRLKKVTNVELHHLTLFVSDKQRHERKEIGALEVNGARKSHQRMDPKTLDSMPKTITLVNLGIFENTGSIEVERLVDRK
jgi:hypothetical protein